MYVNYITSHVISGCIHRLIRNHLLFVSVLCASYYYYLLCSVSFFVCVSDVTLADCEWPLLTRKYAGSQVVIGCHRKDVIFLSHLAVDI